MSKSSISECRYFNPNSMRRVRFQCALEASDRNPYFVRVRGEQMMRSDRGIFIISRQTGKNYLGIIERKH